MDIILHDLHDCMTVDNVDTLDKVDGLDTLDTLSNLRVSPERNASGLSAGIPSIRQVPAGSLSRCTLKLLRVSNVSKLYNLSNLSRRRTANCTAVSAVSG